MVAVISCPTLDREDSPAHLLRWRDNGVRARCSDPRCSRDVLDRLKAQDLPQDPLAQQRTVELTNWGAGPLTRRRARDLPKAGFRPQARVDVNPRKVANRLEEIPVVPFDCLGDPRRMPSFLCNVTNPVTPGAITTWRFSRGFPHGTDFLHVGR